MATAPHPAAQPAVALAAPARWYPEHFAVAAIWLGSVALGLWRMHAGG